MSSRADAGALDAAAARRSGRLSPGVAFYLLASITVSFLAGSSAPTPLYSHYQQEWGFSPITTTVIFGIYAIAVLVALLFTGRLSDHIGRRPVLIATTLIQAATMLIFITADSVNALIVARVIQGLATGAAVSAIGAGMIDIDRSRGTTANAIAPPIGTASGGILAGLLVQFLPAPTLLVYALLGILYLAQCVGVMLMAETISPEPGALASLKPQFRLPPATREPLLLAVPALIATWALPGFYGSLGPTLVRGMLDSNSPLLGGLALFVLAGSGAITVLLVQHRSPRTMMLVGSTVLLLGLGTAVVAATHHAVLPFFVGTAIAGGGFGASFQGAVRSIMPYAAAHERAGVLSLVFVISYLSMGVPAVGASYLLVQQGDIIRTTQEFGAMVMALATLALLGAWLRMSRD